MDLNVHVPTKNCVKFYGHGTILTIEEWIFVNFTSMLITTVCVFIDKKDMKDLG